MPKRPLSILLLVASLFHLFAAEAFDDPRNKVSKIIKSMTEEERLQLNAFFSLLLFRGQFAYTLYGDKPMSLAYYFLKSANRDLGGIRYSRFSIAHVTLPNGWEIWEKYNSYFPSTNYLLHRFTAEDRDDVVFILLINKEAFKQAFLEHRGDFVVRYGQDITADKMLEKCLSKNSIYASDIYEYHELKGILFGYGEINAHLYQLREDLEKIVQNTPLSSLRALKEIEEINYRLQPFEEREPFPLRLISLPYFAADYTQDQTVFKQKYKKQQKVITQQHYKNEDFLERTLLKLME